MSDATEFHMDYVIIGAGSAGCVLAKRLSEAQGTPGNRGTRMQVALVEAGNTDSYHWIHIPVGYLYCIGNPRTDWMYKTTVQAGLAGRSVLYPRGKVLGGTSAINGMIYMRGQRQDYDGWAAAVGDAGWGWEASLPQFKRHEQYYQKDKKQENERKSGDKTLVNNNAKLDAHALAFHGTDGEWPVNPQRLSWTVLEAVKTAAVQAGVPETADFNRGNNQGVGYFDVTQKKGWRATTYRTFLNQQTLLRNNLHLYLNAPSQHLLFETVSIDGVETKRCKGITVLREDGVMVTMYAAKAVILCAGAINSPALLQRSGVGNATDLAAAGITVVHDLPGVGENLQDHLQIRCAYKVSGVTTLNTQANSWLGKAYIALQYALFKRGPMSMAPSQLGAFTYSDSRHETDAAGTPLPPNIQYHVQPLSLGAFGQPLDAFDAVTASVCNLRPTSRGKVQAISANPLDAPLINPNYLSTDEDRRVAVESVKATRNIMAQIALAAYTPTEFKPGLDCQSDADILAGVGQIASTIFHPVGTCKMGLAGDPMAVVDARLRVHGIAGLRVVDASIMPTITSGNTAAPTMMIAEKAAEFILVGE